VVQVMPSGEDITALVPTATYRPPP